ncbi:MAG: dihydroorotate dehydrogenase electron transfer subunit [Desulfobacteraceae bacterium]
MIQQETTVLWNRPVGTDCFCLGLSADHEFSKAVPGQFVMVQVGTEEKSLLRRPFSISGLIGHGRGFQGIELLIKVVGAGTERLGQIQTGEPLNVIGPLGHGFRLGSEHTRVYLAGGGIGIAPIRFLASALIRRGVPATRMRLFLGGQRKQDLLCREDFESHGISVTVTTDDGSEGDQCLITDPLEQAIADQAPDMVYACGPHGMLACVAGIAERTRTPCQVSIETLMACGLGVCLGCAVESVKDPDIYLHACVHGPVFNAQEIKL